MSTVQGLVCAHSCSLVVFGDYNNSSRNKTSSTLLYFLSLRHLVGTLSVTSRSPILYFIVYDSHSRDCLPSWATSLYLKKPSHHQSSSSSDESEISPSVLLPVTPSRHHNHSPRSTGTRFRVSRRGCCSCMLVCGDDGRDRNGYSLLLFFKQVADG